MISSSWANQDPVSLYHTEAGSMLLRTVVALGIGAVLLSAASQAALGIWQRYAAIAAVEQASQRAVAVSAEFAQAMANADVLPENVHWSLHEQKAGLLSVMSAGGVCDRYRWDAAGSVSVIRAGRRGSERIADGLTMITWQADLPQQGGWLRVTAVSDPLSSTLADAARRGCQTSVHQACRVVSRYIAHPSLGAVQKRPAQ